ncbi:MAG: DUF4912 domain-containing protein, partial [Gemmataceae bacterium]
KNRKPTKAKSASTKTPTSSESQPFHTARSNAKAPKPRRQRSAARDTSKSNGVGSSEQAIEASKYELGVPTKDLSAKVPDDLPAGYGKDRIVLLVRDPYWLHVYWELTRQTVERAEAALGQDWHASKPILRLLDVTSSDDSNTTETVVRDVEIHGGCNNWYLDVQQPPTAFRVDIGYLSPSGQFYVLSRSNTVNTPQAGMSDVIDENWTDIDAGQAERIYAMSGGFDPGTSSLEIKELFEERLRRPIGSQSLSSFGSGAMLPSSKQRAFWFKLDAELIVYGATEPDARVTLQGEPVKLRPDGTFTMRFSLPDARQIIPAVAASADGVEERTIVLAVERNTKHLEPMIHDNIND